MRYRLPARFVRREQLPRCIGQKQRWFLLKLREGAAEHCGIDVMSMQAEYVFDWAARILGGMRA